MCSLAAAPGGIKPGDNVLNNPTLVLGREGGPIEWNLSYEKTSEGADFVRENGMNIIRFHAYGSECTVKQPDIQLAEGSQVRVGAWVRTKGLSLSQGGVIIYNWAWTKSDGVTFPKDTNGAWKRIEKVVTVPKSWGGRYTFCAYTVGLKTGTAEVRDPFLEPVDETAAAGVVRGNIFSELGVVTPVAPLLAEIPEGDSDILFSFISRERTGSCTVGTKSAGETAFRTHGAFPLANDRIAARLVDMKPGDGMLRAIVKADDGRVLASSEFPISVQAKRSLGQGTRLNNLVTRLLRAAKTAPAGTYSFDMPRDGWVWISLATGTANAKVYLDEAAAPVVSHREGERFETLRHLKAGRHVLRLAGGVGGELIVNRVPETSTYSLIMPIPQLNCYREYAGDFTRKYLYPVIGIYSCGYNWRAMPKAEMDDFLARGKELYAQGSKGSFGRTGDGDALARKYMESKDLAGTPIVGRTYDEIDIGSIGDKLQWIKAMRGSALSDVPMATWSSGYTFTYNALNAEYLSACCNQARGRGRFQFECYPYSQVDEAAAEKYLDAMLNDTIVRAKRLVPGVLANSWIIMGTYTRLDHALNYDWCDNVDYKRLVDLYLARLATDPEFDGLAGLGLYCYHNAEEEDLRWLSALYRHYLLEGKTTRPSDALGYRYSPDILANGSFVQGLDGWTAEPAVKDALAARKVKGLAKLFRYRASDATAGCAFKRAAGKASRLSRELVNLEPGRLYSLRYAVVSTADMAAEKPVARELGLRARLSGVDDVTATSPLQRIVGAIRTLPKYNVRFIVFRAKSKTARLEFDDEAAAEGEELVLSAVRVKPYFNEGVSF